jgi:hypothetical protein
MALKPYGEQTADDISFFMDETAERGVFVQISAGGSGQALDQGAALVTAASNPSGKAVLGCLLQDVVNKDLTQTHLNFHNDEVQKGGKVTIRTAGVVVTDRVYTGQTPAAGGKAYMGPSGLLQTNLANNLDNTPLVGIFLSTKDADGYVKVKFNLP